MSDCYHFAPPERFLCELHVRLDQRNDSITTHFHIAVGVISGVMLLLLFLIIGLFIRLNKLNKLQSGYASRHSGDQQIMSHVHTGIPLTSSSFNPSAPSPQASVSEYDADYDTPLGHSSRSKKVTFLPRILPGYQPKPTAF